MQNQRASFRATEGTRWDFQAIQALEYRHDDSILPDVPSSDQHSRGLVSSPKRSSRPLKLSTAKFEGNATAVPVAEPLAHRNSRHDLQIPTTLSTIDIPLPQDPARLSVAIEDKPSESLNDDWCQIQASPELMARSRIGCQTDWNSMRDSRCSIACRCVCHKGNRLRSPQVAKTFFGTVSTVYSTSWSRLDSCVSSQCKLSLLRASVVLPRWMGRCIETSFDVGSKYPSGSLRAPRMLPDNSGIFWAARTGTCEHVKRLILNKQASPTDVSDAEGKSVLHVSQTVYGTTQSLIKPLDCRRVSEYRYDKVALRLWS